MLKASLVLILENPDFKRKSKKVMRKNITLFSVRFMHKIDYNIVRSGNFSIVSSQKLLRIRLRIEWYQFWSTFKKFHFSSWRGTIRWKSKFLKMFEMGRNWYRSIRNWILSNFCEATKSKFPVLSEIYPVAILSQNVVSGRCPSYSMKRIIRLDDYPSFM